MRIMWFLLIIFYMFMLFSGLQCEEIPAGTYVGGWCCAIILAFSRLIE